MLQPTQQQELDLLNKSPLTPEGGIGNCLKKGVESCESEEKNRIVNSQFRLPLLRRGPGGGKKSTYYAKF